MTGLTQSMRNRHGRSEAGSALIEFAFCMVFFIIPLLTGTMYIGLSLIRAIQVTEVCRDAAHMYSYGVDFSQAAPQGMLVALGPELGMQTSGGNGVVIFSTVTFIAPSDCTAAGLQQNTGSCPNMNSYVITRRIVVGNSTLHASNFGTPNASIIGSDGTITNTNYLTDTSAQANGFSSLLTLTSGQNAFMAEMWVKSPDFSFTCFPGANNGLNSSARFIF